MHDLHEDKRRIPNSIPLYVLCSVLLTSINSQKKTYTTRQVNIWNISLYYEQCSLIATKKYFDKLFPKIVSTTTPEVDQL